MAKLLNKEQRIQAGVKNPTSIYSRVVSMAQVLPQPAGQQFCFTEALSQHLWLLGIDVWIFGKPVDPGDSWWFILRRGLDRPTDSLNIWTWTDILPLLSPTGLWSWHGYGTPYHMHWDMRKLYEGQSQRFAAAFNIDGPIVSYFQVSFEISEG
ncbi:unnamed protein product [marine sediment metagenome]|uniref:Uncharacterized protein n=1 Tax=marine sediment metagenome TaxID=412755 RepID=X1KLB7_9ZZZZ